MSAQRFRAEDDYFGTRHPLPGELINSIETKSTNISQEGAQVLENNHDSKPENSNYKPPKGDRHVYLTFRLNGQGYALQTSKVKKIIKEMRITPIPRAPGYVKGVANLRDRVIPVVDLRLKLGMDMTEFSEHTCIIVVEFQATRKLAIVGMIVDSVSEVIKMDPGQIQKPPVFGFKTDTRYISGIIMRDDDINMVLNIDSLLGEARREMKTQ
jgi:purine-binding chemotaxis protein CheW